jgi:phage terminase Nu1 subunit (DNA packaging protein)
LDKIALEAAHLLVSQEGAGWIVAVLLGLACIHLHREAMRAQEARLGDAGATATALKRASQSNAALAAALESRTRVLEDLSRVAAEIARSVERNDERLRERLDDILRRLAETRPRP